MSSDPVTMVPEDYFSSLFVEDDPLDDVDEDEYWVSPRHMPYRRVFQSSWRQFFSVVGFYAAFYHLVVAFGTWSWAQGSKDYVNMTAM